MTSAEASDIGNNIPPERSDIKNLKSMLGYLRPYRLFVIGAIIALVVTSGSVLVLGKGVGYMVDEGLGNKNPASLNHAIFVMLIFTVVLALGTFARFFLITYVGERVVADVRNDIYNHLIKLSPEFFEVTKKGEILSRLTTDTTLIQVVVGSSLSVALRNILLFIGGIVLLLFTSPKLFLIIIVLVPVVVFPIISIGRRLRKLSRNAQDKVADISSHAEESIHGIKTIQAFAREDVENKLFAKYVTAALDAAVKRITLRSLLTAMVIMFVFGAIAVVLWAGGHDALEGDISVGKLTSFLFYSIIVAGATGALSEVVGDLQRAAGAAERIGELLKTDPIIKDPAVPTTLPEKIEGKISFENVTFHYPSNPDKALLRNFNLMIAPGETLAVVGPSGAGKSTIFQLLLRFYDCSHGAIKLDDVDIKDLRLADLREFLGVVPQDPVIFSGTIMDNILLGDPEAKIDEVKRAAKAAAAADFIEKLPDNYNSFVGEKGVMLSGGEKQRIAIARTILKNPKILLLDEATSALDTANEQSVQDALDKLKEGRTTVIIAHRLSTVQNADRIIVLEEGDIVEEGTHKQLIKKKGLYAQLARLQFSE